MRAIYWVRDDLRLHDNLTLSEFVKHSHEGVLVWTPSKSFLRAGVHRRSFVLRSLQSFAKDVALLGGRLLLLEGELASFINQNSVDAVYFTKAPTSEEQKEEQDLARATTAKLVGFQQNSLLADADLPFQLTGLPEVFTVYRKMVEARVSVRACISVPKSIPQAWEFRSAKEYRVPDESVGHPQIRPGEKAGLARIQDYFWLRDRLKVYKDTRDGMLEWDDSSKLSPWLSVGALSPREIYRHIKLYEEERGANESTYWLFFELLWRDYFRLVAQKKGSELFTQNVPLDLSLEEQQNRFTSWCLGQTGDDFVDANMHELNRTGWMSNRGRQNVASYLAKTNKVPWQWGASYFEEKLIDYDPCSNWGNWAYLAGVGQDPRNRVFNTQLQASKYDSDGLYRKKWR